MEKPKKRLLVVVREAIRRKHYSKRTDEAYIYWIKAYIFSVHLELRRRWHTSFDRRLSTGARTNGHLITLTRSFNLFINNWYSTPAESLYVISHDSEVEIQRNKLTGDRGGAEGPPAGVRVERRVRCLIHATPPREVFQGMPFLLPVCPRSSSTST